MEPARGTVLRWTHTSRVLRDNPLGDAATRDVFVYLPPGRAVDDCAGLPLILLLPGFGSRGRALLSDNLWSPAIDDRMDALVAAGSPPAVLALPDCSTSRGGRQYMNSSGLGRYQDYLIEELVPWLRERLGTGRTGAAGKSSGGYGALRLGMLAPEVVSGVACHSGDCYFEYSYLPDVPKAASAIARAGSVEAFRREFAAREKKSSEQIITLSLIALSACWSPNESVAHREPSARRDVGAECDAAAQRDTAPQHGTAPQAERTDPAEGRTAPTHSEDPDMGGGVLPFDPATGAFRADVFARWLEHDPLRMIETPAHAAALRSLRLLYIDCGSRDEFYLHLGTRMLSRRLRQLGVAHTYEEFEDGHFSTSYRYGVSLPLLARALA